MNQRTTPLLLLGLVVLSVPFLLAQMPTVPLSAPPLVTPAPSHPHAPLTPPPTPPTPAPSPNSAELKRLQAINDQLLALTKQQEALLEQCQTSRKEQERFIAHLEERLVTTSMDKASLQKQVALLQDQLASGTVVSPRTTQSSSSSNQIPTPVPVRPTSELPPESDAPSGTLAFRRVFILKGSDSQKTDIFHISGKTWRILYHNRDPEKYPNTSALFVEAYPKGDDVPLKRASQAATGGGEEILDGPGDFYLKIDAAGGTWEVAVEDNRENP